MKAYIGRKQSSGRAITALLIIVAFLIFLIAVCLPGMASVVQNPDKEQSAKLKQVDEELMRRDDFGKVLPGEVWFTGNISHINVNTRDGKYECQALLTIYREGTGLEHNVLLYTISPELQYLFGGSLLSGKGIKVWGTEIPQQMEFDGKIYASYRITRGMM